MKTKLISVISAGLMAMAFTACSSDSNSSSPTSPETPAESSSSIEDPGAATESSSSVENPGEAPSSSSVETPENPENPETPAESSSSVVTTDLEPVMEKIENAFANNESVVVDDFANYNYYGAELTGVDQFHYGRFEAKMKMVSIPGSVSSMFLYYDPSWELGEEPWNEIDIEVLGKNKGQWQANLITREADGEDGVKNKKQTSESVTGFGFDATEDFHVYVMEWTPEYISWEIDGKLVRRDVVGMTTKAKHDQVAFMTMEQSLRFNLWAAKSTAWVGKFTGAELANGPVEQLIDYVKVYSYDEATKEFKEEWVDEFEGTELSDHWSRGNWEMEHVTLSKDNVVVEDGYCKLRMTREAK